MLIRPDEFCFSRKVFFVFGMRVFVTRLVKEPSSFIMQCNYWCYGYGTLITTSQAGFVDPQADELSIPGQPRIGWGFLKHGGLVNSPNVPTELSLRVIENFELG